ncbi:MAG: DNA mismatch repair protein MutS [Chlamydiales bacterium]
MTTPMMEQWQKCKKKAKKAILLFRMGDFYEAFHEDAELLSAVLDLTLTKRQGIPMAGVPWQTCETYIDRLVSQGYKVAIAEQIEDPKATKGLVKREIVRFITPGTVVHCSNTANNFIASITQVGSIFGLAFLDLTTSAFQIIEFENTRELINELSSLKPSEILTTEIFKKKHATLFREIDHAVISIGMAWQFEHKSAYAYLTDHFGVYHLDGFGLKGMVAAINAAGGLLTYLHEELSLPIHHIRSIKTLSAKDSMAIDRMTQRNLELTESLDGSSQSTLIGVLDQTYTPMGKRLLRDWITHPLLDIDTINSRLDRVETYFQSPNHITELRQHLKGIRDLERLITRIVAGYGTPRDLLALSLSLKNCDPIDPLSPNLRELVSKIQRALINEPPTRIHGGDIFRDNYHQELDELRDLIRGGKNWLASYQTKIKAETGIKNLKVKFNKIFGYYIEVSKGQASLMPNTFEKRQTLVHAERFISPSLKDHEHKVLLAEEQIHLLEEKLFNGLCEEIAEFKNTILEMAQKIAQIDVLVSFAIVAQRHHYTRPIVDMSQLLELQEGRHPVVEIKDREKFIPNKTELNHENRIMLITGPNMAGKSTYIRQVALIVIMAQIGSFVPCLHAHIGIADKIFTRIGANDNLSKGQSTFMVEMSETASILHNLSSRSLVIIDEIGRGTSTYDGVSIAWSVIEYLLKREVRVLCATHYWELTDLESVFEGILNYHASVVEENDKIIFTHKMSRGGMNRSYGIHVAQLAGLPLSVIQRAHQILKKFESHQGHEKQIKTQPKENQLTFF